MLPDIPKFAQFIIDLVLWIPRKIFELIMDALGTFINGIIGSYTGFSDAVSTFASMGNDILYILSWFHVGTGLQIIVGAYFIRFLIRRIPLIG